MTAISESASRKGRGRPLHPWRASPEAQAVYRNLYPDVRSRRGRLNVMYRTEAVRLLKDDPPSWFCDAAAMTAGTPNAWRPGVLTELGRLAWIYGDGAARELAGHLAEREPMNTRDAAALLRYAAGELWP